MLYFSIIPIGTANAHGASRDFSRRLLEAGFLSDPDREGGEQGGRGA
jgi:hypothetical protein